MPLCCLPNDFRKQAALLSIAALLSRAFLALRNQSLVANLNHNVAFTWARVKLKLASESLVAPCPSILSCLPLLFPIFSSQETSDIEALRGCSIN